jgi:pimeloyl-ACP methyl ester carboxylesterase
VKPVIFVPGFPASELRDVNTKATVFPPTLPTLIDPAKKAAYIQRLTKVPGDLEAGPPIKDILGVAKQAQSLYDILGGKFQYDTSPLSNDFAAIGWDWRLSIAHKTVMEKMAAEVSRLSTGGRKIVAIVHSTGGLVFRAFLEARPDLLSRFEQVMAFGVPWNGTLEALHAMTVGESTGFLFARITAEQGAALISHAQAAYELLPPEFLVDQSWIPADAAHDYMRQLVATSHVPFPQVFDDLPMMNVCGWGVRTWKSTAWDEDKDVGDGTVPVASSSWIEGANVRTKFLPIGAYASANTPYPHMRIWDSPPVLQVFEEVLHDAPVSPFLCACADSDDYIDYNKDVDVRFSSDIPCNVTADLDGSHVAVAMNAEGRGAFLLKRDGITHNVDNDIYRFAVTFRWNGGQASRAVLIKSV